MAREDVEVHRYALHIMTKQFELCKWGHCRLEKLHRCSEMTSDHGMHLITQPLHILLCSNSAMKGNNGTDRILYHDIAAQTITEPPPCFAVGTEPDIPDCRLPWMFSKRKIFLV
jgi:hypothetical protein